MSSQIQFDLEKDFHIFENLIKKRPEIIPEKLKQDLKVYFLPYIQKLIDLKKGKYSNQGLIVGISAIQGVGKTTQGETLEILLNHLGYSSISRSIDDHYITHAALCELREADSRFIRRGVTHDIPLAIGELLKLKEMREGEVVLVSGYDKGAHSGDGDRFRWVNLTEDVVLTAEVIDAEIVADKKLQTLPVLNLREIKFKDKSIQIPENMGSQIPLTENIISGDLKDYLKTEQDIKISLGKDKLIIFQGKKIYKAQKSELPIGWKVIVKRCDFIFYDGWMLGARRVEDESIFESGLPALETKADIQFAKDVNKKLTEYDALWKMFDFMNILYVPDYQISIKWRDQAEEVLRKRGEGMSHEQIVQFVHYFWRSVHPGIHIKKLAEDIKHTDQVVIIKNDHSIKVVLTPTEVAKMYG